MDLKGTKLLTNLQITFTTFLLNIFMSFGVGNGNRKFDFDAIAHNSPWNLQMPIDLHVLMQRRYSYQWLPYISGIMKFYSKLPGCFAKVGKGAAGILYDDQKVQNLSKITLMDNINNTIYTTLTHHKHSHIHILPHNCSQQWC